MQALDKKLLRDFQRLWVQGVAIAAVLACGVAILLTGIGMFTALSDTRAAYYERNRFADLFVDVRRAPDTILPAIHSIDGVAAVAPRVQGLAVLDLPGRVEMATGQILGWPEGDEPALNAPLLRSGTYPARAGDVMVNAAFAEANGYEIGDGFAANINGQRRELTITGTALTPEFVYTIGPGALMPDNANFGILWMTEAALAAAFDMEGAFNHLALSLARDAVEQDVTEAVDLLLDPYGGLGAYGRDRQVSDAFLSAEIDQLAAMARVTPPVFFAIAAFLVSMVMSRIVTLDRAEIGLLKALGYSDVEISIHYLLLAAMIAVVGVGMGWALGTLLARTMAWQYARFFDFPYLLFRVPPWVYAVSGLAALVTTMAGALRAALMAARLAPAVAMQPPAPPLFRRTILDVAMAALRLRQTTIMILRSLIRWPLRALFTALGLGAATASIISAGFMWDSLDRVIDQTFDQSMRQDAMILFTEDVPLSTLATIARLPGILQVEPQQMHAVILRHGLHEKRVALEARPRDADLSRVITPDGRAVAAPPGGLMLSHRLARQMDLGPGDTVSVEFLSGRRETHDLVVTALVELHLGLGAYADMDFLDRLERRDARVSVANVLLDPIRTDDLHLALRDIPALSGLILISDNRRSFEATIDANISVVNGIYAAIAICITIGVAYNAARIQLSERARELASLRILGFSRGEVSGVLVGETMLLAILAQPPGWLMGAGIARALSNSFSSDLYAIPLVLTPSTFATASLVVLAASFVSVMLVRRRVDRMDLVAVMKTRE